MNVTESPDFVRRRGRWITNKVMEIYVQEVSAMMYLPRLEQGQRENIFAWANSFQAAFQFAKRKLPEFKFWFAAIRAVLVATVLTFLPAFDLPVFWPILLAYFIVLVVLTMKDRVRHIRTESAPRWRCRKVRRTNEPLSRQVDQ
eukprot:s2793_g7.t1